MNAIRLTTVMTAALLVAVHTAKAQELKPAASIANQESSVPADLEITLAPDWQVGDSYFIEHTKQRNEVRRGQRLPQRSSSSRTKIEVLESTDSGYVLAATLTEADMSNYATPDQGGAEAAALFTELFEGKTMELVTNEDGVPVGLRNKEEMVELMREAMDQVLSSQVPDPQQQQKMRAMMTQMMTPEVIEAMAIRDAVTFYGLLGGIYQGGPAQAYDLSMQFPFTQEMVDAELHVLLRRIDDSAGTVHISTQNVPDPAHLERAVANWFKGLMQAQGQTLPPGFQFPEFAMRDTVHYVIDRNRMLPAEVTWQRYMRLGDEILRLDREVFRLKPDN